jgi:hypothetical protein
MKAGLRQFATMFAALWICGTAYAASVRAWLDRSAMQLGETVTLNVEVSGDTSAAQPDLSGLAQDFELLGTQSSTSVNIVNGQTSSKLLWAVGLQPKREGTFTIPALTVAGQQTRPLTLTVQPAAAGGSNGGDVYVEASIEPRAPYVQQQMQLSVKLYYALNLLDGNLSDPQGEGLIVRKLGQDSSYNATVGGRGYHVVERHYALLAEKSGTLTLPAVAFRGHVVDGNSMDIFFNRGREVSARSQPITLDVRPRPAASGNDAWLPARSLTLTASGIDASTSARAGEPLTLTLRVQAQGLGFEQLPELKLPAIDGVDIYPDKSTTQNRDDGQWLYGERERKFAIVPNRAGPLTLPTISLTWWDCTHDRAEIASIPELTLQVQPAAGASVQPTTIPVPSQNLVAPEPIRPDGLSPASASQLRWWQSVAVAALGLWLLTVLALVTVAWRKKRKASLAASSNRVPVGASPRELAAVARSGDLTRFSHLLLAQARQTMPKLRNLGDLKQRLADPAQQAAISDLERVRYGAKDVAGLAEMLANAFVKPLSILPQTRPRTEMPVLPELYPPSP